jgi:hypothetical protein
MTDTYDTSSGRPVIKKDPNAAPLDYSIDLSQWLAFVPGDSITAVTWTSSPALTRSNPSFTSSSVTVWLSGGAVGAQEWAQAHFTTAQGRQDERTIYLNIVDR